MSATLQTALRLAATATQNEATAGKHTTTDYESTSYPKELRQHDDTQVPMGPHLASGGQVVNPSVGKTVPRRQN